MNVSISVGCSLNSGFDVLDHLAASGEHPVPRGVSCLGSAHQDLEEEEAAQFSEGSVGLRLSIDTLQLRKFNWGARDTCREWRRWEVQGNLPNGRWVAILVGLFFLFSQETEGRDVEVLDGRKRRDLPLESGGLLEEFRVLQIRRMEAEFFMFKPQAPSTVDKR